MINKSLYILFALNTLLIHNAESQQLIGLSEYYRAPGDTISLLITGRNTNYTSGGQIAQLKNINDSLDIINSTGINVLNDSLISCTLITRLGKWKPEVYNNQDGWIKALTSQVVRCSNPNIHHDKINALQGETNLTFSLFGSAYTDFLDGIRSVRFIPSEGQKDTLLASIDSIESNSKINCRIDIGDSSETGLYKAEVLHNSGRIITDNDALFELFNNDTTIITHLAGGIILNVGPAVTSIEINGVGFESTPDSVVLSLENNFLSRITTTNLILDSRKKIIAYFSDGPYESSLYGYYGLTMYTNGDSIRSRDSIGVYPPIGIENEIKDEPSFSIYPNPSNGIFTIQSKHTQVFNISGTLIFETNRKKIDLSSKPKGLYFIVAVNNDKISTHRIILE